LRRLASIDIGTNTALLLIAEVTEELAIHPLVQKEKIVRLGEGVDERRLLKPEAVARTLAAVGDYMKLIDAAHVEAVVISGTSAVRDARNREELINQIKQQFGVDLLVLSGDEEARLTYFGAISNKHLQGDILLIDIGGGSTEFIFGTRDSIKKAVSLDIGSVRLTERFARHDPIRDDEYQQIREFIDRETSSLTQDFAPPAKYLIGVAGTITTIAAIKLQLEPYDPEVIDNVILTLEEVSEIVNDLKLKTLAEKRRLRGLNPDRADVILAGSVILQEVLQKFGFTQVQVSDRGLRFGMLLKYMKEHAQ
jgi:exopolyphosphatase/guanosine-5'-triphosphate,3'-diphosphate pyrophosphatase